MFAIGAVECPAYTQSQWKAWMCRYPRVLQVHFQRQTAGFFLTRGPEFIEMQEANEYHLPDRSTREQRKVSTDSESIIFSDSFSRSNQVRNFEEVSLTICAIEFVIPYRICTLRLTPILFLTFSLNLFMGIRRNFPLILS